MSTKTLDVQVMHLSAPPLMVALHEREVLDGLSRALVRRLGGGGPPYGALMTGYRAAMGRARSVLSNKQMQALMGVFDDEDRKVDYAQFEKCSADEASAFGLFLAAERIRSLMDQVASDFAEAVLGPADLDQAEPEDGDNVLRELVVAFAMQLDGLDQKISELGRPLLQAQFGIAPTQGIANYKLAATNVAIVTLLPGSGLELLHPNIDPGLRSAATAMFGDFVHEIFDHLTDPEIVASRQPAQGGATPHEALQQMGLGHLAEFAAQELRSPKFPLKDVP